MPFFWTEQNGVALRYGGHAPERDELRVDGDVAGGDFTEHHYEQGEFRASASVGRDLESLEDERRLESRVASLAKTAAPPVSGTFAAA